ncbi:hypothetical protein [Hansschlegelia plantiphila]|uniref:Uncharacterized protein n=1 Tax=Hansschlegelia plantiphila TaxID=374655 RepID=A0A9W6MVM4_9HYPH|nr:hypothetical protein [Hansschlegelia plantiphila]GLK68097.1 hypothetical protein GCM10008179_17350 [Hansschlegelia plantiphila]
MLQDTSERIEPRPRLCPAEKARLVVAATEVGQRIGAQTPKLREDLKRAIGREPTFADMMGFCLVVMTDAMNTIAAGVIALGGTDEDAEDVCLAVQDGISSAVGGTLH